MVEPLALLLLPCRLEDFELAPQAQDLLSIPRVIALEPSRRHTPKLLRETAPLRQAKRLKFPGELRVLVLYHPMQYPLARALGGRHQNSELWYMRPEREQLRDSRPFTKDELLEFDVLAAERAVSTRFVAIGDDVREVNDPLRLRLRELEVISPRPFVPGARIERR